MKKLIVFDMDGTLAPSKSAISKETAVLVKRLLAVAKMAVISGGGWPQFEKQLLGHLEDGPWLDNLTILPTCGTQFFRHKKGWKKLYSEDLTDQERKQILGALKDAIEETGLKPEKTWGEQIEDRGTQITFSALGQDAPLERKQDFDPDHKKRQAMAKVLIHDLPGFSAAIGGTTSIDITRPGVDKAYGLRKLVEVLKVKKEEIVFIGDALFPGGNDYPARSAGVDCIHVRDPHETQRVIEAIISCLKPVRKGAPS